MQYVPTSANLLATMADLLDNELLPALPGSLQHKARVAANVCRILERQERARAGGGRARARPARQGCSATTATERALGRARRDGCASSSDTDFDRAAWEAIVAIVRDDLAIAKPGHDVWEGR